MQITITEKYRCDDIAKNGWAVVAGDHCGIGATLEEAKHDVAYVIFGQDIDPNEVIFEGDV